MYIFKSVKNFAYFSQKILIHNFFTPKGGRGRLKGKCHLWPGYIYTIWKKNDQEKSEGALAPFALHVLGTPLTRRSPVQLSNMK